MAFLLYCIMEDAVDRTLPAMHGVSGAPVSSVSEGGLRAVVSRYDPGTGTDLPGLIAYRDVIDSCHRLYPLVPMRYGCIFPAPPRIVSFLREHRSRFRGLLKELDGLVEMGIRLLISECGLRNWERETGNWKLETSGKRYLGSRKAYYAHEECTTEARNEIAEQFRAALTGLFVKCKVETSSTFNLQWPMLSLYFLVPRGKKVETFQRTFQEMKMSRPEKLLLSGPWPPFNFV